MPITDAAIANEIIKFLGFDSEKISTSEDFKNAFEPEAGKPIFIHRDKVKDDDEVVRKIMGPKYGSIDTALKAALKEHAIDFDDSIKDKTLIEKIAWGIKKQAEINLAVVTKLKEDAGKNNDAKVTDLQKALDASNAKLSETSGLLETNKLTFETFKTDTITASRSRKINDFKNSLFANSKLITSDDLRVKGFKSDFNEKYKIELDDTETPFITDASGKKLASTIKTGEFKTAAEIFEEEAVGAKLWNLNPNIGQPPKTTIIANGSPIVLPEGAKRTAHSKYR